MALFLAESWTSRSLWLGTVLALSLGGSFIVCAPSTEPTKHRVFIGEIPACEDVLLKPRHIYVRADNQRALDVALLTVAEHPEWQVHIASDIMGGEQLPGYRLDVSTSFSDDGRRTFQCSAMVTIEHVPQKSPIGETHSDATATRESAAYQNAVNDACITSTVEDAVEQALEYLPTPDQSRRAGGRYTLTIRER